MYIKVISRNMKDLYNRMPELSCAAYLPESPAKDNSRENTEGGE
jgi:hypothetical protein